MRPLTRAEIVDLGAYAGVRDDYRRRVIAYKRSRRVSVGEKVSLVFEDRETLRFQVQEMLWIEQIADPEKVQHELDVYNELLPGEGELSATLFIEIPDLQSIRPELQRLIGIDECVSLLLSRGELEERVPARFDASQLSEERISAVHYLRFRVGEAAADLLRDPTATARLGIDHPNYTREVWLSPPLRQSLIADLTGDPVPLLLPDAGPAATGTTDPVLFASAHVRALCAAAPAGTDHVIVEPVATVSSLFDAGPDLERELLEAVKRAAAELVRKHGDCRIQTDVGDRSDRLRWHLHAPIR